MKFRRFLSLASISVLALGSAQPSSAQTCPLLILCTRPAPVPPPVSAPLPSPAVPPVESVTQPVGEAVGSVGEGLKTPVAVLESQMLALINRDRGETGLAPLQNSGWAQSFARNFSEKMMAAGTIWHNPEYFAKGRAAMGANLLSENVGYDSSILTNHLGFMESPSHRVNILDRRLTHVGIGVAVSQNGRVYVTEDFARIPGAAAKENAIPSVRQPGQWSPGAPSAPDGTNENRDGDVQEVETLTLPGLQSRKDPSGTSGTVAGADPIYPQSPAPMIPGLVTGGLVALLGPAFSVTKKILLALNLM